MWRTRVALVGALACSALATAQQPWVDLVERRLSQAVVGSIEWYRLAFQRVAVLADRDLGAAAREAGQLWSRAGEGMQAARQVAAAWAALALTIHEGPEAARQWDERATEPHDESDPWLRAEYYLVRSRTRSVVWQEADALRLAVRGQELAEQVDDWYLRGRAALATLHSTPSRRLEDVRELLERARDDGQAALADALLPSLMLAEVDYLELQGDYAAARALLARVAPLAEVRANRRMLARVKASRATLAISDPVEGVDAMTLMEEARQAFAAYGNLVGVIFCVDQQAELAIVREDLDAARDHIAEQLRLMDGRGLRMAERDALITQFNLALKEHDGKRADELSQLLDEFLPEEERRESGFLSVQDRLVQAERDRAEFERRLQRQQLALAEQSWSVWMWSAITGAVALCGLLAVSWLGRRRLLRANQQLADKVQQLEEARTAKEQLERRMRQLERTEGLGTLAAGVAHDFNNLLTSMVGGAQMLRERQGDAESRELAEMILSAGQQGSRLCRQLQSYSGGTPLVREPHDVRELIEQMLPTLVASTHGKVDVSVTPDSGSPVARLDRTQFEQILLNLVQNSFEANARSVTIAIDERTDTDGERVARLRVVDDGRGMAPEVVNRIFDPFFTTKFPGRGLGLAVVFGGVKRHGGRVRVQSSLGCGTDFTIELPLAAGEAPAAQGGELAPAAPERAKDYRGTTVVVVDDEPIVRRAMHSILVGMGCEVEAFESGADALAFVGRHADRRSLVVIVDLTMPVMDGEEVVRRLHELEPGIRIVLMSGHGDEYVHERARELAIEHVLIKPFLVEEVRDVLQRVTKDVERTA